jgi:ribosome biogenesis protein MAK21
MTRVRAIVKRLLQVALHERSNFVCAALVVVSETMRLHDAVRDMISVPEVPEVPEMSAGVVSGDPELAEERARQLAVMQSVVAEEEHEAAELRGGPSNISSRNVYNPLKENPLRSNADNSCAWELLLLAEHNHPTVAIFAKQLLNLSPIQYDGDPLLDFSLASFLDRFAYKAPKKDAKRRPADHEIKYDKKGVSFAAVAATADSREFLNQRSVRPEEEFMLEHMKARQEHKKLAAQLLEGGVDDEGNVDSELLLEDDDVDDLDEIEMGDIEFGDDDDLDDLDEDEEDEEENDDEEDDKNDYLWADDGLAEAFERDDERAEKEEEEERHERKRGEKKKRK